MKKAPPAESPDAYVAALDGWQRTLVERLRHFTLAAGELDERIKWGHLVYFSNGPALLIRAEETRVLFGFWRGKRLSDIDGRLKPSGKYELANIIFGSDDEVSADWIKSMVEAAIALNRELGDPRAAPRSLAVRRQG